MTKRIRGRRLQRIRKQILTEEPLCRSCADKGRVTAAEEIDHIIPLFAGGPDTPDNRQGLCAECHAEKTALESERYSRGFSKKVGLDGWPADDWHLTNAGTTSQKFSIPHYLRPSNVPVHLVYGAPGSGKSSYARAHAKAEDIMIDFDLIRESIGASRYDNDPATLKKAFKRRDAMLRALSQRTDGEAWLVVMAPTREERKVASCRFFGHEVKLT